MGEDKKTLLRRKVNGLKKEKIKSSNGDKCYFCGCSNKLFLTVDHRVPKSRGGSNEEKNLRVMCHFCNQLKGSLTCQEFRKYYNALVSLKSLSKLRISLPRYDIEFFQGNYPITEKEAEKITTENWYDEWGEIKHA